MVHKVNKSLKDWVAFVKKVQKEEGISYADAMKRAKVRKDGGEKWISGGAETQSNLKVPDDVTTTHPAGDNSVTPSHEVVMSKGGNKKQKTAKKQQKTSKKQKGGRRKTCYKK